MKITCTADLHLGRCYRNRINVEKVIESDKQVIAEICRNVSETKSELLFIVGDLFDNNNPKEELYHEVMKMFVALFPAQVFILPGNHDPNQVMWSLPANVHVFREQILKITVC